MTIADELNLLYDTKENIKNAIINKGVDVSDIDPFATYPQKIESIKANEDEPWAPDPLWWDIKTILEEDTEDYAGKYIVLLSDLNDTISFKCARTSNENELQKCPVAMKTSDGSFYSFEKNGNAAITHTWDKTKDKQSSNPALKTRYVIYYTYYDKNEIRQLSSAQIPADIISIVLGVNPNTYTTYDFSGTMMYAKTLLQSIDILDGFGFGGIKSFYNFCYNCYNLQKLPDVMDVSGSTDFRSFLYACNLITKLPDTLDISNGTLFTSFCSYCRNLRKVPEVLDFSNGTLLNGLFYSCCSLEKIPDIDASQCTNMNSFLGWCFRAKTSNIKFPSGVKTWQDFMRDNFQRVSIPGVIDLSDATNVGNFCTESYALSDVRIKLPMLNMSFSGFPFLSYDSMKYMADNAPTITTTLKLTLGATNIARAGGKTGEIVTTLTEKGWTVA